jgi:hypothetical protein
MNTQYDNTIIEVSKDKLYSMAYMGHKIMKGSRKLTLNAIEKLTKSRFTVHVGGDYYNRILTIKSN